MRRVVNIARGHKEAAKWDLLQQTSMSPEERQRVAKKLKERVFGKKVLDVRGKRL